MAVDEEENVVVRMIYSAAALRSETLDLGGKGICEIPKEILDLKYLEVGLVVGWVQIFLLLIFVFVHL